MPDSIVSDIGISASFAITPTTAKTTKPLNMPYNNVLHEVPMEALKYRTYNDCSITFSFLFHFPPHFEDNILLYH